MIGSKTVDRAGVGPGAGRRKNMTLQATPHRSAVSSGWLLTLATGLPFVYFFAGAANAQNAGPQSLRPRWQPSKSMGIMDHTGIDRTRIIVKFNDDLGVTAANGRFTSGPFVAGAPDAISMRGGVRVDPLFRTPAVRLAAHRAGAQSASGSAHADLSQFFIMCVPAGDNQRELLQQLLAHPSVENAYYAPREGRPPGVAAPAVSPLLSATQSYRSNAPLGVGSAAVGNDPAGAATGVRIADIEYDWNLQHEDLTLKSPAAPAGPAPVSPFGDPQLQYLARQHGTAVAGILAANSDNFGTTGIAHQGGLRYVAANTQNGESVAAAIVEAMDHLQPGDVILIEHQVPGPNFDSACTSYQNQGFDGQFGMVPVEYLDAEFHAITMAVAAGFHVIEAAGNGGQDLDNLESQSGNCRTGDPSYIKFNSNIRDSGATLVTAGTASVPHYPMFFSNVGRRIDCYSFGEQVATLGFGDHASFTKSDAQFDENRYYTDSFGGSSAAAAIVAGCAAVLESKHAILYSFPLRPANLRLLMRTSGTASQNPRNDRIGVQPDLRLQLQTMAALPNVAQVQTGFHLSNLGASVAWVADTNQDNSMDIAAGAPNDNNSSGRVELYSSVSGELLQAWSGQNPGDLFGFAVASAGDINGDGLGDVVIGAPGGTGNVYIYADKSNQLLQSIQGPAGSGAFGWTVTGGCDLTGDGICDFVVGSPGTGMNTSVPGSVSVLSGSTGSPLLQIAGSQPGELFGGSLQVAGDINQDGIPDIMLGLPGANEGTGAAKLVSGANGAVLYTWNGQSAGDRFGYSVASVGDVNRDGHSDVAVGAPDNAIGGPAAGRVYVYHGSDGSPIFRRSGEPGDRLGFSVGAAGDVNRDAYADVIAGAPGPGAADPNTTMAGRVYVYSGANGKKVEIFHGEVVGDGFGWSVAGGVDADHNDIPDLVVGAPFSNVGGTDSGRMYTSMRPVRTLYGLASYGTGTPGCEGPEFIFGNSNPNIDNPGFAIRCSNAPPLSFGMLLITNAQDEAGSNSFGLGALMHVGVASATELEAFGMLSDKTGSAETTTPIPNDPQLIGKVYFAQAFWSWTGEPLRCTSGLPSISGLSSSNGLWIDIQPR